MTRVLEVCLAPNEFESILHSKNWRMECASTRAYKGPRPPGFADNSWSCSILAIYMPLAAVLISRYSKNLMLLVNFCLQ
ncbi:hypothetical protein ARMGADRAFT_1006611 [Armillaria gallica]|uniref:Uncharacterized protein n=1 Tax=Armillaria gallica TaxID=47427 RepID=A0A2H3DYW3_ARMGA|nr:hypothetical protein ARMGADRAFT_1006611 [Armillaria gallica]